jgi:hypothetical protein
VIELVAANKKDLAVWETILEISEWFPASWTLIGARMVQLHAMAAGREVPRVSLDADALADVRAMPGATSRLSASLIEHGFVLGEMSTFGLAHRFVRDGVSIDVLAPDGLRGEHARLTVGKLHTVQVPGGTQGLRRTVVQDVRIGRRRGRIPVPNLLGAILLKARAVAVDDVPDNQRIDLALLLSLVGDVEQIQAELWPTEKSWLRRRGEMSDANTACWRFLRPDDAQRGLATFRQLTA